jgi:hypothetical protein
MKMAYVPKWERASEDATGPSIRQANSARSSALRAVPANHTLLLNLCRMPGRGADDYGTFYGRTYHLQFNDLH